MQYNKKNFKVRIGIFLSSRNPQEGGGYTITYDIFKSLFKNIKDKNRYIFIIQNDFDNSLKKIVTSIKQSKSVDEAIYLCPNWMNLGFAYHYNIEYFKDYKEITNRALLASQLIK